MSLEQRLATLQRRIELAAHSSDRAADSVTLVAVTKTIGIEAIRQAYDLGLRDFGESRVQDALPKIEALPHDIRWHFVGRLQSNKARRAASSFHVIHTLESESQLSEMIRRALRSIA